MLKTEICELLGIRYPIIQGGMGPFGTNKLCIAAANAGILGLISSAGVAVKDVAPKIYRHFVETGGASVEDDTSTALKKMFRKTLESTREKKGVFGVNVMVSAELRKEAEEVIDAAIEARDEDPEMKERFTAIFTTAGDPLPWTEKIRGAGFKWFHVSSSVRAALRCRKAGVDGVVASGHEGGGHTAWEPVHSMVLLPAVVDALSGSGISVVGAGGFSDGKTLVAALTLGAVGVQMGTRFLATKESDFPQVCKDGTVKAGDRGTLIARGIVGPLRWLKNPPSLKHAENTLKMSPGVYLGRPDDLATIPQELYLNEIEGLNAVFEGDESKALLFGGECAQRIDDLPNIAELVEEIMRDASEVLEALPKRFLV